jgi:FkbM family methyltransferase
VRRILAKIETEARFAHDWLSRRQRGAHGRFFRAGGNEQLVSALPLESLDIVVDAGAYEGKWVDEILCRYGCRAILFEPVAIFAAKLRERYKGNDRVELVEAALGSHSGRASMNVAGDGSSLLRNGRSGYEAEVDVRDVSSLLQENMTGGCGCLKLNIEGLEYEILEKIVADGLTTRIKILLVQFHGFIPGAQDRRARIQRAIAQTHSMIFDYPFVWECWIRR